MKAKSLNNKRVNAEQACQLSIIIPIYNIEKYLDEAIQSVLQQNLDFESSCELLLVDDGSTDSSVEIAKDYAALYPKNITYIRQENTGVSKARNIGLKLARGQYVHFLDGDDTISKNFYERSIEFLEDEQGVDFVASKLMFFDAIIDSHPLNYKFQNTRVINVATEPDAPLLHVVSCVFRKKVISETLFDERLKIAEDVKFISDALVDKGRYGVLSETTYHYRKRADSSSAIGGKESKRYYYLEVPKYSYRYMLDTWEASGEQSLWAEHTVLYDIAYRLKQKSQAILSEHEEKTYKELIISIVSSCSDEAIATTRFLTIHQKMYILEYKYGKCLHKQLETKNGITSIGGHALLKHQSSEIHLDFLTHVKGDTYRAEGYVKGLVKNMPADYQLCVKGKKYILSFVPRSQREQSFLGEVYDDGGAFEVEFTFPLDSTLHFSQNVLNSQPQQMKFHTGPFTRFGALRLTYRCDENRLIKRTTHALVSRPYSRWAHVQLEVRMIVQILLNWRLNTAKSQLHRLKSRNLKHLSMKAKIFEMAKPLLFVAEAVYMIPRALILRTAYHLTKRHKKRPLWIVSDRGMAAGDNGEAFFRYLMKRDDVPARVYFAISKHSKDYKRIRTIGPVLHHGSLKHKLKHLLADKIISSQADIETTNPFIRQFDHYVDLMNFEFIFLQHGVIRHDLSDWLNRFNKNIGLFVVTAKKEYDSIFINPYYYEKEQVILSGLPRYDRLANDPQNKIILAPTYRKNLARMKTDKNGARKYDSLFKTTEYRNFYNNLINDKRLRTVMKKHEVLGEFYLHPAFSAQTADFNENESFKMMEFPYDYGKAFREGSLMISDHSSVMFDFAYLRKPILYAHFDVDTFFEGHTYNKSNFFSDADDGFGEVCYDYESLVNATIKLIENNFSLTDKYRQRIDTFFAFNDTSNSKRLYDGMIEDR